MKSGRNSVKPGGTAEVYMTSVPVITETEVFFMFVRWLLINCF
jgi:hypothetical protein